MDMLMFLILAICIFGFFLPSIKKKYDSSIWRLVYVAPLILAVLISGDIDAASAVYGKAGAE